MARAGGWTHSIGKRRWVKQEQAALGKAGGGTDRLGSAGCAEPDQGHTDENQDKIKGLGTKISFTEDESGAEE